MPGGRPKKPDELKLLKGTWRRDQDGDPATVIQAPGVPAMPRRLTGEAAEMWGRVVPGLIAAGLARECDTDQLALMCEWYGRYREYSDRLDTAPESQDTYRLMIQVGIANTNFDKVASRFGLTPSDRAKLRADSRPATQKVVSRKRG